MAKIYPVFQKIESASLIKCPRDHRLTNKAHLSAITVANNYQSFYLQDGGETSWHRYGTKLRHCHPMYLPNSPKPAKFVQMMAA